MAKQGDFYIDNDTGDYYLYNGTTWVFQGNLKGPQGDPGPTGPSGTSDGTLKVTKVAGENLLAGDAVKIHSSTQVKLADKDSTLDYAIVFGIATQNATTGNNVEVLLLGEVTDSVFSPFSVGDNLFLDTSGGLTDVRPTSGFHTPVATAMGGNKIFVNPRLPTKLA